MQLRLFGLLIVAASFVVTTTTCTLPETRKNLANSYRLARFRLEQCRRMGASELDREQMELAERLSAETEMMIAAERWRAAQGPLTHLEETVARLLDRLKTWDPDGDGLSTYAEFMLYGTSWSDPDTDGDGYLDGTEVLIYGTDPLDPCAFPVGVQPEKARTRACPSLEGGEPIAPPEGIIWKKE
ncbi:MAG TPA: thrombospondin type 3 repeat-containing protein [Syntrophobacteria bacterium]|nr:thrombospondin type 3 repeat-containing protein [Syntrophobacteria bacterium]